MKKNFSFLGLFFGMLLANQSSASFFYLVLFGVILVALFSFEKWGIKKITESKKMIALYHSGIFLLVALSTGLLYVNLLTEAFLKVFLLSVLIALIGVYLPNSLKRESDEVHDRNTHVILKEDSL